jgi:hypothetical protein
MVSKPWTLFAKPWSWYAQNYMRSVPVVLFLAQATWTSTLGTRFDVVACWRSGQCNSGSYWLCHSEGHVICHFMIIHGGSFGYKMFSILRVRQNEWTTTSFRARKFPRHATPLAPITILFHRANNSAQIMISLANPCPPSCIGLGCRHKWGEFTKRRFVWFGVRQIWH